MKQTDDPGSWNPYLAGALTGLVAVASVFFTGKFLGASTSFVRSAGMLERLANPERVAQNSYFSKCLDPGVSGIDWQWMFVIGILLGALIAAATSGSFRLQAVPDMWQRRFGVKTGFNRALTAFIGGTILLFGARLAGGCPSGHGLSGVMQLAVSGLVALVCFFAGGMLVARLLYGKGDDQ